MMLSQNIKKKYFSILLRPNYIVILGFLSLKKKRKKYDWKKVEEDFKR